MQEEDGNDVETDGVGDGFIADDLPTRQASKRDANGKKKHIILGHGTLLNPYQERKGPWSVPVRMCLDRRAFSHRPVLRQTRQTVYNAIGPVSMSRS
jgi:hypothetical protein